MKRVGCLYRVSTKRQTYNNDIPLQKEACRKFIESKESWILRKEYLEPGVSGYKLGENERDVLQDIKRDVLNKEIDIFLVFMFDRIGRKENETPFVVKWLIDKGIEVWSVNEGQRIINNSYDRLINYITYWQAEGESEKISVRAKERRIQLTKDGIYLGNYAPYGYKMVNGELYSKIGKKRRVLNIYNEEADIIKLIYELIAIQEYGTDKVAIYLNSKGIKRRKAGCLWDSNMILDIVRNPIYKGYVSFGKRKRNKDGNIRNNKDTWIIADKQNPDITIISEEIWQIANDLIDSRRRKRGDKVFRLLSGYTKCGYCGNTIVYNGREKNYYMLCKGKQKTGYCEYNKNYRVDILEQIVMTEVKKYLDTYKKINLKKEIMKKNETSKKIKDSIKILNQKISYSKNKLAELKTEVVSVIMSGNKEENEKISEELKKETDKLSSLNEQLLIAERQIRENNQEINNLEKCVPIWSKEFERSPLEIKRQILDKLIDKIYLYNEKVEIQVKYPVSKIIVKESF